MEILLHHFIFDSIYSVLLKNIILKGNIWGFIPKKDITILEVNITTRIGH